ncbi:hypothetical protein BDV95DRAFT_501221 [Massariosphaeria phaeospora]|uniref:BTB domain-containing protein n=1 Tax=Massariosphaeria phaeospora TaxID=100035 RepID=A0A7C8I8Z6_9PLEO|nr:hypothetical protein BDV95DRAFT_501221 [Massariosphaeria phaeospora]
MNQAEDVEVILAHDRIYKFHSGTLARNSTLFAQLLTEPAAAKLGNRARNAGIKVRWMVELKSLPSVDLPAGRLALVPLNPMGERADGRSGMVINENGRIPTKTFEYYESIFYAFYAKDIEICDDDMGSALTDAVHLIEIAEYLGCVSVISKPVEVALVKQGQALFRGIQELPYLWIVMAHRLKSELIFREAIIHLAGNWNRVKDTAIPKMQDVPGIQALCEKYHEILVSKSKKLELALMSTYPGDMCEPTQDLPIKREEYSKDILVWMALTFFRHWLGQRIITERGHQAPDKGYALFRMIGQAGDAYMEKTVINQFHVKFPMTKKAMNVLENHLLEIKECMRNLIDQSAILKPNCQLDVHRYPADYLTCVDFVRADLPWLKKRGAGGAALVGKHGRRAGGNDIVMHNLAEAQAHGQTRAAGDASDSDDDSAGFDDAPVRNKRARLPQATGF